MPKEVPLRITPARERVYRKVAHLRDSGATTEEIIAAGLKAWRNQPGMRPRLRRNPNERGS